MSPILAGKHDKFSQHAVGLSSHRLPDFKHSFVALLGVIRRKMERRAKTRVMIFRFYFLQDIIYLSVSLLCSRNLVPN